MNVRTFPLIDWFTLKQVFQAALLIISASRVMNDGVVLEEKVTSSLNSATEIFARTAKTSESAKRALQLLSEIRVGMKRNET